MPVDEAAEHITTPERCRPLNAAPQAGKRSTRGRLQRYPGVLPHPLLGIQKHLTKPRPLGEVRRDPLDGGNRSRCAQLSEGCQLLKSVSVPSPVLGVGGSLIKVALGPSLESSLLAWREQLPAGNRVRSSSGAPRMMFEPGVTVSIRLHCHQAAVSPASSASRSPRVRARRSSTLARSASTRVPSDELRQLRALEEPELRPLGDELGVAMVLDLELQQHCASPGPRRCKPRKCGCAADRLAPPGWRLDARGCWMVALAWLFQRRLIYLPTPGRVPPAAAILHAAQDVAFDTADGLRLAGWFVPAAGQGRATVLVLNGNAGNRAARAPLAAELSRAGLSVLLVDYRGYGDNPGSPSESGLLADARAARAYLAARGDVDLTRLVYFGESLGAAVAVRLAIERPPMALVLRSPFTSLADIGRVHYPFLPVRLLLRDRYASIEQVGGLRCPVLVVAGDRDGIVPWEQSRRLAEAIPEPKRFVLVPGADHNDLELLAGRRLIDEAVRFVADAGRRAGRRAQP